jgi:argininosuccinate synthase
MSKKKLVLAYSGGLDTSCAIHYLKEQGYDIIAMLVDVGQTDTDFKVLKARAMAAGASDVAVIDGKEEFADEYILPAIKANAMYEGAYPLSTALARPLIAKHLVEVALAKGAEQVGHGCTGKGNDQVRFELTVAALAPHLKVVAPVREWGMTRAEEVEYCEKHDIPIDVTKKKIYSIDDNMYGRSIEGGCLEDPWIEPPEDVFLWTAGKNEDYVEIEFESGKPIALNGKHMPLTELIMELNKLAGACGVGRIDHIESRVVGIKSREVYECPAAVVLNATHTALEKLVLQRDLLSFKKGVEQRFAENVYEGTWFSPLTKALCAFIDSTQEYVTGIVKMKMSAGALSMSGISSPYALYSHHLATYDAGSSFDQPASSGFIYVLGLPLKAWGMHETAKVKANEPAHTNGERAVP